MLTFALNKAALLFLYQHLQEKKTIILKIKYKAETKLYPTFTSFRYACGGMLYIGSMLNSYQVLSLKV